MVTLVDIDKINLKSPNLVFIRKNKRNALYRDKRKKHFLKIFIKEIKPVHNKFLLTLLQDESFIGKFCPYLVSLVIKSIQKEGNSEQILMGYIMREGKILTKYQLRRYFKDPKVQQFWMKGMRKYNFFYNDFKANNLIFCGSVSNSKKIGLIDLEALQPFPTHEVTASFKESKNVQIKIKVFGLKWYYDFLEKHSTI